MPEEAWRQRMLIMDRIEDHLKQTHELSPARRTAINDTRHATARTIWRHDRQWARKITERIRISDPYYIPRNQPASPLIYSLAYRVLGFELAQALASWKRILAIG
jgi:hypothetical protein